MAYPKGYKVTLAGPDRDGICAAQQRTGAGALTLDGALVSGGVYTSTDSLTPLAPFDQVAQTGRIARKISLYSAGNLSAVSFTVTGTLLRYGPSVSETVTTGPNNGTVLTSNFFLTVTGVATSATISSNVEVGTGDSTDTNCQIATPPIVLEQAESFTVDVTVNSGTISLDAQQTIQDVLQAGSDYSSKDGVGWKDITNATGVTSNTTIASSIIPSYAVRAITNSYSSTPSFTIKVLEAD